VKQTRIIIVDDHKFYRKTLGMIIEDIPGCKIVAEASNGKEFLEIFNTISADIIFMDIKMPEMDGIIATHIACNEYRNTNIIALTMFEEKEYFMQMMHAGARGFLLKDTGKDEIENAIKAVLAGKNYYPKGLAANLFNINKTGEEDIS